MEIKRIVLCNLFALFLLMAYRDELYIKYNYY